MRNPLCAGAAACLLALLLAALAAQAQEQAPERGLGQPENPREWHFVFEPYLWAMGMDGNVTARGLKTNVNVDFAEIFRKDFDIGGQAHFEARKDRWAMFIDGTYVRVSPGGAGGTSTAT